ncbi:MAG: CRISPR-associated endonuclease Cas2 [Firmicutes bacterium]|jgi:CRISPR-associated protein Cas2|nr:CRISPR-associated endonuclease Cas2 [Bacillota bacterium]
MYDVEEKRCHKVFKICKKYLIHYQKSIFRGNITPSNLVKLRSEIKKTIKKEKDTVAIIKMVSSNYYDEEVIGLRNDSYEDFFL